MLAGARNSKLTVSLNYSFCVLTWLITISCTVQELENARKSTATLSMGQLYPVTDANMMLDFGLKGTPLKRTTNCYY